MLHISKEHFTELQSRRFWVLRFLTYSQEDQHQELPSFETSLAPVDGLSLESYYLKEPYNIRHSIR